MVVPSLAIRFWKENDKCWAEAPWMDVPISGDSWEDVYDKAIRARALKNPPIG